MKNNCVSVKTSSFGVYFLEEKFVNNQDRQSTKAKIFAETS